MKRSRRNVLALVFGACSLIMSQWVAAGMDPQNDIRNLSTHFRPNEAMGVWKFHTATGRYIQPKQNVVNQKDFAISLQEHPGLLTIRHSGADEELKGTIGHPIGISDYHH